MGDSSSDEEDLNAILDAAVRDEVERKYNVTIPVSEINSVNANTSNKRPLDDHLFDPASKRAMLMNGIHQPGGNASTADVPVSPQHSQDGYSASQLDGAVSQIDGWTPEEFGLLVSLVEEQWKDNHDIVNWDLVAAVLRKDREDVIRTWESQQGLLVKKGTFTPEEDQLIIHRWLEWKVNVNITGVWANLEKELNRRDKRIAERWRAALMPRVERQIKYLQQQNILPESAPEAQSKRRLMSDVSLLTNLLTLYDTGTVPIPVGKHNSAVLGNDDSVYYGNNSNTNGAYSNSSSSGIINRPPLPLPISRPMQQRLTTATQRDVSVRWTPDMDQRLAEGIRLYVKNWFKIAEMVGMGTTKIKCRKRWYRLQRKTQPSSSSAGTEGSAISNAAADADGGDDDDGDDDEGDDDEEGDAD